MTIQAQAACSRIGMFFEAVGLRMRAWRGNSPHDPDVRAGVESPHQHGFYGVLCGGVANNDRQQSEAP
jgi:hypothetical protein